MTMVTGALSALFWGLVLLSLLVFIHEGGHYLAARSFGVRVTEFYLGLPCRVKVFRKSKKRGTEFGLTPFLLGGYNRICGMEGHEDELLARAFAIVQREGRANVEAMAEELGVEVDRCYAMLATLADWAAIRPYYDPELGEDPHQREYPAAFETLARDGRLITEYDEGHDFDDGATTGAGEPRPLPDADAQLAEERKKTYLGCSFPKRLAILVAGPLVNVLLALVLVTAGYMSVEYQIPVNEHVIGTVSEGSIAERAGLRAGDEILAVGDTDTSDWIAVAEALGEARKDGKDFDIRISRDGTERVVRIDLPEGEEIDAIGVVAQSKPYHLNLIEATQATFDYVGMVGKTVVKLIMPQHTMEVLNQSSSIVGISVMASEAASKGFMDVMALMAAISLSLGFMNLLPIPPLDGGKILLEVIEAIRRKPLSDKAQLAVSYAGIAFFVFVFIVVVRNDVLRIFMG